MAAIHKRDSEEPELTRTPVEVPPRMVVVPIVPEFVRLPKPGELCPFTGMARSALNGLILPTEANNHKPPVRSFVLRKRGARTGIRLIDFRSLVGYVRQHPEDTARE